MKRIPALLAASALAVSAGVTIAPTADAATTVSGYVTCIDQEDVAGVWIAADGGSGYATRSGSGYNQRFTRGGISGSWTVHVGCGTSGSNWRYTANGNTRVSGSYQSWSCYTADIVHNPFCQTS